MARTYVAAAQPIPGIITETGTRTAISFDIFIAETVSTTTAVPTPSGGAFTRRPDRIPSRRLSLRDLQEHFSAEQEAWERVKAARRAKERKALEDATAAVSRTMRAAVGADSGIEPDLAKLTRDLETAAAAKRINDAVRLANEAAARAAKIEQEITLEKARYELWLAREREIEDDDAALLTLL